MMKEEKEIQDNEIRVIGTPQIPDNKKRKQWIAYLICVLVVIALAIKFFFPKEKQTEPSVEEVTYFENTDYTPSETTPGGENILGTSIDSISPGFCELKDTMINDIPLCLYIPHNAIPSLYVGDCLPMDSNIVYIAQAADIRKDNMEIVGAFVMSGKPLAWGLSKKGYCAIIHDQLSVGVAENSPLFEKATETNGYFFRQYPLVDNGKLVENTPKNKSYRRALCERNGEILMVESTSRESFHDFSQALVDLGVNNAIYLVGGTAYGWAIDEKGARTTFGIQKENMPANTSYLIWNRR